MLVGLNQLKRKRKSLKGENNMEKWLNNKKVWAVAAVIIAVMLWNYFQPISGS